MRPTCWLLSAVLLAVAVPASADDEALRKNAIEWLKAKSTPKQFEDSLIKSLSKPITDVTKDGHNFTFLLGSKLTRSEKPVMVCGWVGEVFAFDLTEGQAKALDMKDTTVEFNANRRYGKPNDDPAVTLSDFKVTDADNQDGGKPIKGSVKVKVNRSLKKAENLRFRLDLKFADRTAIRFYSPRGKSGDGDATKFSFDAINEPGSGKKPLRGPVGAFMNIVEGPEDKLIVHSNTLGVLLDVD